MTDDMAVDAAASVARVADWIKGGEAILAGTHNATPYRWHRGDWRVIHMQQSPVGEFVCVQGPEFVAYLRPHARQPQGHLGRLDLRCGITYERLMALPAELAGTPGQPLGPRNADLLAILGEAARHIVEAASKAESCRHADNPAWASIVQGLDTCSDDIQTLIDGLPP